MKSYNRGSQVKVIIVWIECQEQIIFGHEQQTNEEGNLL